MEKTLYIAKHDADDGVRSCQVLGDYTPKGFKIIDTFFVDSSGFGQEGEGALTLRQFLAKVKAGRGYAIREAGQFQVYINEYIKL